jgi:hypothetical protein
MQAIITKYIGPTNSRGARIKAECGRGKIFFSYPYELSGDACHRAAVDALTDKFAKEDSEFVPKDRNPWKADYVTGQIPSGEYVHVFAEGGRTQ